MVDSVDIASLSQPISLLKSLIEALMASLDRSQG